MNVGRFIGAVLAVFAFMFFYEWLLHGHFLMPFYEQTRVLWRDFADMQSNMHIMVAFQLALATWTTLVFTQIYPEGGVARGILFGLFFGVFAALLNSAWWQWLPVPNELGIGWFLGSLLEGLVAGFLMGLIYRR